MMRKLLALAAVMKLAAAYSVAIPRITKDLDGTKIDIDVQVDIDTGDDGSAEGPKGPGRLSTPSGPPGPPEPPAPYCLEEGRHCHAVMIPCCDDLICNMIGYPANWICEKKEIEPTSAPEPICIAEGQECGGVCPPDKPCLPCCDDMICKFNHTTYKATCEKKEIEHTSEPEPICLAE